MSEGPRGIGVPSRPPRAVEDGGDDLPEMTATALTSADDDSLTHDPSETASQASDAPAPFTGPEPLRGAVIGRYTVLGELGSGGMGVVYKAWDPALDRPVALKVMLAGRLAPRRHVARFLDEARAIARLDHPALVAVFDIGVVDGCPFYTMEYVEGQSLDAALADAGFVEPRRACRLLAAVARGLSRAHAQGIIHRDVKPANILIDADDGPRLIDFGIARFLESTDERTRTGQVVGTPAYMAPEQARGQLDAIGPPTDVFGLGAVLYRCLTGAPPGRRALETMGRATGDGPPLPRDVVAICHKALADAPGARYPSTDALAADLERFVRGEPVEAAVPGPWRRFGWRLRRARPVLLGAALAALAGLAIWLGASAWRTVQAERARDAREAAAATRLDEALSEAERLRAAGSPAAADAVEAEIALRPDVQETRALARFHLRRAAAAGARGDPAAALDAAASAHAVATAPAERFEAMATLGRLFAERFDAAALRAVVETLGRRFPERAAEIEPLRLSAAVLDRRSAEAVSLAPRVASDRAPMFAALARATDTGWTIEALGEHDGLPYARAADLVGDPAPELVVGRRILRIDDPKLPEADVPPLDDPQAVPVPMARGRLVAVGPKSARLLELRGEGPAARWEAVADMARAPVYAHADLDGDGVATLYACPGWHLYAYTPDRDGVWQRTAPHPPTEATQIHCRGFVIADFGPRDRALLVGTSGWRTHDVRLYRAAPDGLDLAARLKLGEVSDAIPLPRPGAPPLIAVTVQAFPGDTRVFPTDRPRGAAPGVHLLEWTDAGLVPVDHLPQPVGVDKLEQLIAGDFDGDGLSDLVVHARRPEQASATLIYRALPGGRWAAPIPVPDMMPLLAVDLDADPAAELVVIDRVGERLWVLGAGDAAPPDRPSARISALTDARDDRAAAIEELVQLGLVDEALDAWRLRMRVGPDPAYAAWRAAELARERGRPDEAAPLYLAAADEPTRALDALTAAADAWRAARRPEAERAALDRLAAHPGLGPEARAQVDARLSALRDSLDRRLDLDFGAPLDPRWRIAVPDRLHIDRAARALDVRTDLVGPIARLPLTPLDTRVALEVELETPRVEYGGSFAVRLMTDPEGDDAPGEPIAQVMNLGWGGGTVVYQRAQTVTHTRAHILFFNRPLADTAGDPIRVRIEVDAAAGEVAVTERTTGVRTTFTRPPVDLGERLWLDISGGPSDRRFGQRLDVRITALGLDGLRIADLPADDPLDAAARALADADPPAALAALGDRAGPEADAIRAAALYDLGRWAEADAIVLAHLPTMAEGSPFERFVRGRILRDPTHFAPLLRKGRGPAADDLLWRVYSAAFDKHAADPEVIVAAQAVLLGAEDDRPEDIAAGPHAEARLGLLLSRAAIRRATGRIGGARADLARCEALLRHLPPPLDEADARRRGGHWTDVYLLQAGVAADAGDFDRASEAARAALAVAPAPELAADRIIADRGLRRLMDRPVWAAITRAAAW